MAAARLPDEELFLNVVIDNLQDDMPLAVYADWLEEQGDKRSHFLRSYINARKTMNVEDFPIPTDESEEWRDVIGYRMLRLASELNLGKARDLLLSLARPALAFKLIDKEESWINNYHYQPIDEAEIPIGVSKSGGLPDLPPDYPWPRGKDCVGAERIGWETPIGIEALAGFMAQINLSEITNTQAGRSLPDKGLLSFFCIEDLYGNIGCHIAVCCLYFEDCSVLHRTAPPSTLLEGNHTVRPEWMQFKEGLDLPSYESPWDEEIRSIPDAELYDFVIDRYPIQGLQLLGYDIATNSDDPTPSKDWRHLIRLESCSGSMVHIQILNEDLQALRFDRIELVYVTGL